MGRVLAWLCAALAVLALAWALTPPARAADRVDVAIVFVMDISGSMGPDEIDFARRAHALAIASEPMVTAIVDGAYGRVAMAYVEYADSAAVRVGWTIIDSPQSAAAFAGKIDSLPPGNTLGSQWTFIGAGLMEADKLLSAMPVEPPLDDEAGLWADPHRADHRREGIVVGAEGYSLRRGNQATTLEPAEPVRASVPRIGEGLLPGWNGGGLLGLDSGQGGGGLHVHDVCGYAFRAKAVPRLPDAIVPVLAEKRRSALAAVSSVHHPFLRLVSGLGEAGGVCLGQAATGGRGKGAAGELRRNATRLYTEGFKAVVHAVRAEDASGRRLRCDLRPILIA